MKTLAVPLSFSDGYAVVLEDTEDEYYAHLLALNLQIEPDELPITSDYGVYQQQFSVYSRADAIELAARFIPEISIGEIFFAIDDNGNERIAVSYVREG